MHFVLFFLLLFLYLPFLCLALVLFLYIIVHNSFNFLFPSICFLLYPLFLLLLFFLSCMFLLSLLLKMMPLIKRMVRSSHSASSCYFSLLTSSLSMWVQLLWQDVDALPPAVSICYYTMLISSCVRAKQIINSFSALTLYICFKHHHSDVGVFYILIHWPSNLHHAPSLSVCRDQVRQW